MTTHTTEESLRDAVKEEMKFLLTPSVNVQDKPMVDFTYHHSLANVEYISNKIANFFLQKRREEMAKVFEEVKENVQFEIKRFEDKATIINFDGKGAWQEYKNGLSFALSEVEARQQEFINEQQ